MDNSANVRRLILAKCIPNPHEGICVPAKLETLRQRLGSKIVIGTGRYVIALCVVQWDRAGGAQGNRGWVGYRRRERKRRKTGVLRGREEGEK